MRKSKFLILLLLNVLMFGVLGCLTYSHLSLVNYVTTTTIVEKDTVHIPIQIKESIITTFN